MTNAAVLSAVLAALASGLFALVGVVITSTLAQKREHASDWRQVKIDRYQEYIAALSAIDNLWSNSVGNTLLTACGISRR